MTDKPIPTEQLPITIRFGDKILDSGFTPVPNLLLYSFNELGISRDELVFIVCLLKFKWTDRNPFPSLATIAGMMGCSWRQSQRYAKSLEDKGFIQVKHRYKDGSRSVKERGLQTSSEYDLTPLFNRIRQLDCHDTDPRYDTTVIPGMTPMSYKEETLKEETSLDISKEKNKKNGENTSRKRQYTPDEVEEREVIAAYLIDFLRAYKDTAKPASSITRAHNLFKRAGVLKGRYRDLLYQARQLTNESTNVRNRPAYFWGVLEDLLGLKTTSAKTAGHDSINDASEV